MRQFNKPNYRVLSASMFFSVNLDYEIDWHKKHIAFLKKLKQKPKIFHTFFTSHGNDSSRQRHFKEHVVDSIPFHERILEDMQHKKKLIRTIIDQGTYNKLSEITLQMGFCPDYFVANKVTGKFFFVHKKIDDQIKEFAIKVMNQKKICDVIVLER